MKAAPPHEASSAPASPIATLDHLVVAARSLAEGAAWCQATLGVVPSAGGRHALMGTHNLLLAIGSARFPRSYLEIIAVDPEAPAPRSKRWFDLDSPWLQAAIAGSPCLVHWVASTADLKPKPRRPAFGRPRSRHACRRRARHAERNAALAHHAA